MGELFERLSRVGEEPEPPMAGLHLGRITKVNGGQCHFVLDDFARELEFGPVDYPRPAVETGATSGGAGDSAFEAHTHKLRTPATPPVATEVVVGFIGGDPDRPEILKLKGWPA